MAKWQHDKIKFSGRGIVHLPLGGEDRQLRFRSHEIEQLEMKLGMGVMAMLDPKNMGVRSLKQAIIAGVAHEYGKKKGGKRKTLTETEVGRWIDDSYDKEGIEFEDLQEAIMRAVIGGLPNGAKLLASMDEEDDAAEGEEERSPLPSESSQAKGGKKL